MSKKQNKSANNAAQFSGGVFVTVMSKLPFGLSFKTPDGEKHIIKGMNQGLLVKTEGALGSYASTQMKADVWEYFAKKHAKQPYLVNKIIFAKAKEAEAEAEAKELDKDVKSKLEQIDPKSVPGIETSQESKEMQGVIV